MVVQTNRAADVSDSRETTLLASARKHWRALAPAWAFPIVFFCGSLLADRIGHPNIFFVALLPLFFWSFGRASGLWLRREIRYGHAVFWCIIVPFVIWGIAVFAHLAVVSLAA